MTLAAIPNGNYVGILGRGADSYRRGISFCMRVALGMEVLLLLDCWWLDEVERDYGGITFSRLSVG